MAAGDITWSDVSGAFPTDPILAAIGVPLHNAVRDAILEYVNTGLSAAFFGGETSAKYTLARIYFAAHMGRLGALVAAAAGPVTSESEDGLARTYALVAKGTKGSHPETAYGVLFDDLVRSSPRRAGFST